MKSFLGVGPGRTGQEPWRPASLWASAHGVRAARPRTGGKESAFTGRLGDPPPRLRLRRRIWKCLGAVESGNVEAGLVYQTDAAISRKVKIAFTVAAQDGPRISYPMALVKESKQPAAAGRFLDHLAGPEAGAVFARRGFIVLRAERRR